MEFSSSDWRSDHGIWAIIPYSPNIVTVRVCSKLTENRLFLQTKSGRILDISWAFLIKQLFVPLPLISNAHSWNNC